MTENCNLFTSACIYVLLL